MLPQIVQASTASPPFPNLPSFFNYNINVFSLLIALLVFSSEIGSYSNVLFGYINSSLAVLCSSFGAGKKVSKSIFALSSFVLTVHVAFSPRFVVSVGTLALLPSDA